MWYVHLASVFLIGLFLLSLLGRERFSPVRVFTFVWCVSFVFHSIFGGVYQFSGEIILVVVMGIFSYNVGAFVFWSTKPTMKIRNADFSNLFLDQFANSKTITFGTSLAILLLVPLMARGLASFSGRSLTAFFSAPLGQIMQMMQANHSILSQANELNFPVEFKIATLIIVVASVICFFRIAYKKPSAIDLLNIVFLLLLSLTFSAVASVRSMILIPMIIGVFSFYTGCLVTGRSQILTSRKTIAIILSSLFIFTVWVLAVQSARLGDVSFSRLSATMAHMRPWIAGYLPALSVWAEGSDLFDLGYGQFFFGGIFSPLGFGVGEGFETKLGHSAIGNWQASNAMTIFRIFVMDFGLIGAAIFPFFLGFLGEFFYHRAMTRAGGWIPILIAQYCWTFFSINYWFFFYGARVFGFIGCILLFYAVSALVRRKLSLQNIRRLKARVIDIRHPSVISRAQ